MKAELEPTVRLFARLLLRELDAATLTELRRAPLQEALRAVGVELPAEPEVDGLAAEYFAVLLQPEGSGPLVQSLWTEGTYEGRSTRSVRELASACGLELDPDATRGAPPDHLGAILLLWCETHAAAPELARRLEEQHMSWCAAPLARAARQAGFYGAVAAATGELVERLCAPSAEATA